MLANYIQPKFLSRIFTDPTGRQFCLTFLVTVVDGEVRGRLISAEPISPDVSASPTLQLDGDIDDGVLCLPTVSFKKVSGTEYKHSFVPVISPYTELYFFTSQPTRAPSYR